MTSHKDNFNIVYPKNSDQWLPWQQHFRYGALYVFPSEPLAQHVNNIRETHDPFSHAICKAHISLTVPFPRPLSNTDIKALAEKISECSPIRIQYGPAQKFQGSSVVYLKIEPRKQIEKLVSALEEMPLFSGAIERRHTFLPHMTLVEFVTPETAKQVFSQAQKSFQKGDFLCKQISYSVPNDNFEFSEQLCFALESSKQKPKTETHSQGDEPCPITT